MLIPQSHKPLCPCPRQQPPGFRSSPHIPPLFTQRRPQSRHLAGIFLNHLLWLNSSPIPCSITEVYSRTDEHERTQTVHKYEHMHGPASARVRARVHNPPTGTLVSERSLVRIQKGRQPPVDQQAERSNNLPQATCSSRPPWGNRDMMEKGRERERGDRSVKQWPGKKKKN